MTDQINIKIIDHFKNSFIVAINGKLYTFFYNPISMKWMCGELVYKN